MTDLDRILATMPTEEEMDKRFSERVEKSKENPNVLSNWFPVVKSLGIPYPETDFFYITKDMYKDILNTTVNYNDYKYCIERIKSFGDKYGYPLFLKNGVFSNKHDFKHSCVINEGDSLESIADKIANIQYNAEIFGVELSLEMVIRKYLDVKPIFYAFNETPIVEEYRLFVNDGIAEGWQAYWPQDSIKNPDTEHWSILLEHISEPSNSMLSIMKKYAESIGKEIGGYWSVDFLIDANGEPYLIDMALGNMSYKDTINFILFTKVDNQDDGST